MITVGETYQGDAYDVLNEDGDPQTGTTVTVTLTLPDTTTDVAVPEEISPGTYTFSYATSVPGRHEFSVRATGGFLGSTVVELGGDVFNVAPATSGALVGLREAKERLGIEPDVTDDDEQLRRMIVAASQLVERESRVWHRCTVVEEFPPAARLVLSYLPVVSVTTIQQAGADPIDASGFEADAAGILTPLYGVWPWQFPNTNKVTVVYEAGEQVVPEAVQEAVLLTLDDMWSATRGPAALPLSSEESAGYEPSVGYALPPAAEKLLTPWQNPPGIA